jgi:hypothetical protein
LSPNFKKRFPTLNKSLRRISNGIQGNDKQFLVLCVKNIIKKNELNLTTLYLSAQFRILIALYFSQEEYRLERISLLRAI